MLTSRRARSPSASAPRRGRRTPPACSISAKLWTHFAPVRIGGKQRRIRIVRLDVGRGDVGAAAGAEQSGDGGLGAALLAERHKIPSKSGVAGAAILAPILLQTIPFCVPIKMRALSQSP